MNIKIIKGELDQLKDELLVSETAHKNLTGLLNMLEKQLTLTDVGSSSTIKKGKIDDLGTSNRRLDRDIDDKFM